MTRGPSDRVKPHRSGEQRYTTRRRSRSTERHTTRRERSSERRSRSRSRSPTHRHHSSHKHEHRHDHSSYKQDTTIQRDTHATSWIKHEQDKAKLTSTNTYSTPTSHPTRQDSADDASLKSEQSSQPAVQSVVVEKPNYNLSGLLALDALQRSNDNVLQSDKYSEPSDAAVPSTRYRLYCFKDNKQHGDPIKLDGGVSCYMIGRDDRLCWITLHHPSISSQHAVIQFKQKWHSAPFALNGADAVPRSTILPYLMDLDSTNGTQLNHRPIESRRYIELRHKDVLRFGQSEREYVFVQE
jgi:smad nuclear-interacting protein 1